MATLIMLNNFMHDFSAAGWLFGTVLLWATCRGKNINDFRDKSICDILRIIVLLMSLSFAGIIVFGLVRLVTYKNYEWNDLAGQSQVTLLIVKHIVFAVIFAPGIIYYLKVRGFIKSTNYEKPE